MASPSTYVVPFYRIGVVFGVLTIKFNPHKIHGSGGPFDVYLPLLVYSFVIWLCFITGCIIVFEDFRTTRPRLLPALDIIIGVINTYFVVFLCIHRKAVAEISNKLYSLHMKFPNTNVTNTDLVKLMFPVAVYFFKLVFDYDWYSQTPMFHLLGLFYATVLATFYAILYSWLVYGEKFLCELTYEINCKYMSARLMKGLIMYLLDVEEFVRLVSKYFGIFYLIIGLQVVGVYILHLSGQMLILLSFRQFNKASLQLLIHTIEWNVFMYMLFFTSYQSHKLTLQVQKLKHDLEEVHSKKQLPDSVLRIIMLFKRRVKNEDISFSAFESVQFNFQRALTVLNTIITFMSTISSITFEYANNSGETL